MKYIKAPVEFIKFDGNNLNEIVEFLKPSYFQLFEQKPLIVKDFDTTWLCFIRKKEIEYICKINEYIVSCDLFNKPFRTFTQKEIDELIIEEE